MIVVTLIQNVALLVALMAVYQVVLRHRWRHAGVLHLLSGLLFGGACVIGMMTPLRFAPGIIFDGRSIILSVAGLFGGPLTAAVAAAIAGAYRLWLGGAGAGVGLAVIFASAALGVLFHYLRRRDERVVRPLALWGFGLLVHLVMLTLMLALPGGAGPDVLRQIGLPVLIAFPLATALLCLIFLDREEWSAILQRHSVTLQAIGDAVIAADSRGRVELLNPVAEALTGWTNEEARGRPLEEVFRIVNEETGAEVESPMARVLREGVVVGLANHTLLLARDGRKIPIADSGAPIRDESGDVTGVVLVFRDQTKERLNQRLTQIRLNLIEYATTHSLGALLTRALDEIGAVVDSPIGFYHFVGDDQKTLSLQGWSTRTLEEFCRAEGRGMHYGVDQAGVWADCVRARRPVIHNDYESLPHKKGMPDGHAKVVRELVVPVMRGGRIVAILGVGNKPMDYTERDVEIVSYLADVTWEIVERKRAEEALRESEEQYRLLAETTRDIIILHDMEGRILYVNQAGLDFAGFEQSEAIGRSVADFIDAEHLAELAGRRARRAAGDDQTYFYEAEFVDRAGRRVPVEVNSTPILREGRVAEILIVARDLTARKRAEEERDRLQEQLLQAQKMEAIGRLAGGVAHDFNNMLQTILGYAEMGLHSTDPSDPLHADLEQIRKAARRSADLTGQLLAFARRQMITPKVLDLNETVDGMIQMLRRLIGEDINLTWLPGPGLWLVRMDLSQIDQILVNLCVNARDAIAGVGEITIETANVVCGEDYCANHMEFLPGEYVMLAVSDDGRGMDRETLNNIFEPFFTTKGLGRGTGLGLSTVYGIVKQNEGFINVYSEPGKGTTFKIYLPRYVGEIGEGQTASVGEIRYGRGETILLVEDEPGILDVGQAMLERLGYQVLVAHTPAEALRLAQEHAGEIHLLITDVVIPQMNGAELRDRLRVLRPGIKTLFMSGYTANVIAHRGVLKAGVQFIPKPFSVVALAGKVREALEPEAGNYDRIH